MVRSIRKENPKVFLHIVCEGWSEYRYCEALNQFFNRNGIETQLRLVPYPPKTTNSGCCLTDPEQLFEYAKKIKSSRTSDFGPTDSMYIFMDTDTFYGQPDKLFDFRRKCMGNGIILLKQENNFEDFLMMHLDLLLPNWIETCSNFQGVMTGAQVVEEIIKIIPDYKKGRMPTTQFNNIFSLKGLSNCKKHSTDPNVPFRSDFVEYILVKKFKL